MAMLLTLPATLFAQAKLSQPAPSATVRPASVPATTGGNATPDKLFKTWDKDRNGVLNQQEFTEGWTAVRRNVEVEQRLAVQFKAVDANHDGGIDAAEYANLQVVRKAGKAARPLQAFDANRDQRLQFGEYIGMLRRFAASGEKR